MTLCTRVENDILKNLKGAMFWKWCGDPFPSRNPKWPPHLYCRGLKGGIGLFWTLFKSQKFHFCIFKNKSLNIVTFKSRISSYDPQNVSPARMKFFLRYYITKLEKKQNGCLKTYFTQKSTWYGHINFFSVRDNSKILFSIPGFSFHGNSKNYFTSSWWGVLMGPWEPFGSF